VTPLLRIPSAHSRGFTLVEALVVIALAAGLAAAAAAMLPDLLERRRVQAVGVQAAALLQAARLESQTQGRTVRASFHADAAGSCLAVHTGPREDCHCPALGQPRCNGTARLVGVLQVPSTAGLSLRPNVTAVVYDPVLGTASPTASLRVVGARGTELRQIVNLTGRVRTCVAAGTVPGAVRC
jgi:type IV fimbrial biogenesis protein FimT